MLVRDEIQDTLKQAYEAKQKDLLDEDIRSFNAYMNEKVLRGVALQEITDRFKVSSYDEQIGVVDRYLKKTFYVRMAEGKLVCVTDEVPEDVHTFFVKHDPKVREALKDRGIMLSGV